MMSGKSAVAYFSTVFENGFVGSVTSRNTSTPKLSKAEILQAPHESVAFALRALKSLSYTGFLVCNEDNMHSIGRPVLVSCVPGIPAVEDMLSVKQGARTCHPCPRCLVLK